METSLQNPTQPPENANVLDRNIGALINRRREQERQKSFEHKLSDVIARFAGSLPFVYVHAGVVNLRATVIGLSIVLLAP